MTRTSLQDTCTSSKPPSLRDHLAAVDALLTRTTPLCGDELAAAQDGIRAALEVSRQVAAPALSRAVVEPLANMAHDLRVRLDRLETLLCGAEHTQRTEVVDWAAELRSVARLTLEELVGDADRLALRLLNLTHVAMAAEKTSAPAAAPNGPGAALVQLRQVLDQVAEHASEPYCEIELEVVVPAMVEALRLVGQLEALVGPDSKPPAKASPATDTSAIAPGDLELLSRGGEDVVHLVELLVERLEAEGVESRTLTLARTVYQRAWSVNAFACYLGETARGELAEYDNSLAEARADLAATVHSHRGRAA